MAHFVGLARDRFVDGFRGNGPFPAWLIGARRERCVGNFPSPFSSRESGWHARSALQKCGRGCFGGAGCGIGHICPLGPGPELKMIHAGRYLDVKVFFQLVYPRRG